MMLNSRFFRVISGKNEYRIENKGADSHIYLYDEVSPYGVSAENFIKDLNAIKSGVIHLHINSPGGLVFDGLSIYNTVKNHPAKVIAHIEGLAASISSIIPMAADEVVMSENSMLMVHDPYSLVIGGAKDMRKEADLLEKVGGDLAKTYADRTGLDVESIAEMMKEETWFTAREALENKFVNSIDENKKQKDKAPVILFDLSMFQKVPDKMKAEKGEPTIRDAEKALKACGFQDKRAKEILAKGFPGQRDAEPEPQRDAVKVPEKKRDRVTDLLIRAEMLAPSRSI